MAKKLGFEFRQPRMIKGNSGPEFISKALDKLVYVNKVTLNFLSPGEPTDNPSIKGFHTRLRQENLNED